MNGELSLARGDTVWELCRAAPAFAGSLQERGFDVASWSGRFEAGIPLAPGIAPADGGEWVRPYRHLRAFYLRVEDGVLAVKGSEPFAADLIPHLQGMAGYRVTYPSRGKSLFSALEHFPLVEQKTPLAVPLGEALEDAERALAWQHAHLERFDGIAHAPLPLRVVRWPESVVAEYRRTLLPMLSARARAIIERVLNDGLGCLIYHYPTLPLRAAHLDELLGGTPSDYPSRRAALEERGIDPRRTVDGWLEQGARMLAAGYLPGSVESIGIGHCLEAQNAVVDGGFVDLGSMREMAEVEDPRLFTEAVLAACADLAKSIRTLLLGALEDPIAEYRNPSLRMTAINGRVFAALRGRLAGLAEEAPLEPRLMELFGEGDPFHFIDRTLKRLHPADLGERRHA